MDGLEEILGKKDKIIIVVMLVFVFAFIFILNGFGYFENQKIDEVLNEEFETIVIDKYIDKSNHMTPKVKLSNGNEMINFFPKSNVELSSGDSLVKRKNSTDMLVFRDKKLVYSISMLDN
ncbi:hypothetical protein [Flavobacterium branchiicola]|uniref:Uncharacterized protein n=1 Tax=Flavobacterium branchiicola TaxID=1114875 RepID=A0ABV9PDT7_9FLAO|nr:hypothetical protein [Flavobacterium branchiicola]MBS7254904.1 hypothetical protein [Flavobacterium branchiicola]